VDELSTSAKAIPEIKKTIRSMKLEEAKIHAQEVLKLSSVDEIEKFLSEDYARRFGKDNKSRPV